MRTSLERVCSFYVFPIYGQKALADDNILISVEFALYSKGQLHVTLSWEIENAGGEVNPNARYRVSHELVYEILKIKYKDGA